MRSLLLAATGAALLAACSPSAPSGGEGAGAGASASAFPTLNSAPYRLEAMVHPEGDPPFPLVMVRDGQRMRMESTTDEGPVVVIVNYETNEALMISNVRGQRLAIRTPELPAQFSDPTATWQSEVATNATRTGECSVAGVTGSEWSRTEEGVAHTACVTEDGIFLRATEGGRTTWEATRVVRGPQPAEQFAPPPGVRVMDMSNMGGLMEAIQQGQRP